MIQELLLSLNQSKKSKCITSINVRKSSAFISMQRAWKASRDDASQKGFKGCFRITKKQSILDHNLDSTQPRDGYAPSCSLLSYAKAQWMDGWMDGWIMPPPLNEHRPLHHPLESS